MVRVDALHPTGHSATICTDRIKNRPYSVSVDDMKVLLRNSLLKYPKTATLLQPHEIQQLLKQSASNAAEIAMTTYWGYITTATETQPRELLEQEITRLQDELRRLKEK